MIQRKILLHIDDVSAGAILAVSIPDGHGGILLPEGTVLTDGHLQVLGRRGVDRFSVVNTAITQAELEAERERVIARVEYVFRLSANNEANAQLKRYLLDHRLAALE